MCAKSDSFCFPYSAQNNGGAIYMDEFAIVSIFGKVSNNRAGQDGGAVASVGRSMVLLMADALLTKNSA